MCKKDNIYNLFFVLPSPPSLPTPPVETPKCITLSFFVLLLTICSKSSMIFANHKFNVSVLSPSLYRHGPEYIERTWDVLKVVNSTLRLLCPNFVSVLTRWSWAVLPPDLEEQLFVSHFYLSTCNLWEWVLSTPWKSWSFPISQTWHSKIEGPKCSILLKSSGSFE